jgi:GDP-L-fucose synthase
MQSDSRIYVAGHAGLVGSAIVLRLQAAGYTDILTATRQQHDPRDQAEVSHWFKASRCHSHRAEPLVRRTSRILGIC